MTDQTTAQRPYSPGLEGVIAGETSLSFIDGERGRLLYRGYRIADLVRHGTYAAIAELLWTGEWRPDARLTTGPVPDAVMATLRALPASTFEWSANDDGTYAGNTLVNRSVAGASFQTGIAIGKFHGVISPTTPSGRRIV